MTNQETAEQIAQLVRDAFKANGNSRNITGIMGATQPTGEVRRELMLATTKLQDGILDNDTISKVDANVRTANAMGLVTDETYNKILDLLGTLKQG